MEEVAGFARSAAGFGAAREVAERKPSVLLQGGVAEVFGAEEKKRVEQHDGGVGAQLLALPQVRFGNARGRHGASRAKDKAVKKRLEWHEKSHFLWNDTKNNAPVHVRTYKHKKVLRRITSTWITG